MVIKRFCLYILIVSALLLTTCDLDPSFDEYEGENFLAGNTLADWSLMPDMNFEEDAAGTSATDYMDFSPTGETGPAGGPVYRLEIKNLLTNGDFESATDPKTPWVFFNTATDIVTTTPLNTKMEILNTGSYTLDNNTAYIQTLNEEYIKIKLKEAFIIPRNYVPGKRYYFQFDYRTAAQFTLYFIPNWKLTSDEPNLEDSNFFQAFGGENGINDDASRDIRNTYPPISPVEGQLNDNIFTASETNFEENTDSLGITGYAEKAHGGYLDNFRIIRGSEGASKPIKEVDDGILNEFDLRTRIKLTIDHRDDMELIDGYYKFSIYVKEESTLPVNSFHSDRVELGIRGYDVDNLVNVDDQKVFYKTEELKTAYATTTGTYAGDWSEGWVQLVFASSNLIQVSQTSDDPVLELSVSPSNPGSTDSSWNRLSCGSILIADPVLEYSESPWE